MTVKPYCNVVWKSGKQQDVQMNCPTMWISMRAVNHEKCYFKREVFWDDKDTEPTIVYFERDREDYDRRDDRGDVRDLYFADSRVRG